MNPHAMRALYERMFLIRTFEECLLQLFADGKVHGTTHAYIGQEANAVGVIGSLRRSDVIFSNHRCHGHYLALFDDPESLLAEITGKLDGVCGGKGGSQHLQKENFYTNGVQGGIVPCAAGMALAEKMKRSDNITVAFLGDGTLGQGVVYETLNIASLWRLPLLFVVENNHYAQSTHIALNMAGSITGRAEAFGIGTEFTKSTDVLEIHQEAERIARIVREEQRPVWWVIDTYRLCPHSKGDDCRDPSEIARFAASDPLLLGRRYLGQEELTAIEERCRERMKAAMAACGIASSPSVKDI